MPAASPPALMAAGALRVATRYAPRAFMRATISSVRKMPCSTVVMPASTASAIPSDPCAWAAVRRPALRASSMAARISSRVSWEAPGSTPRVIRPIRLAADPPAVAARHADGLAGGEDARPGGPSLIHCAPHRHLHIIAAAEVAHGGHARLHRLARAQERADRGDGGGLVPERAHRIRLRAQAEVDVTIDEAGQERVAGEIHAVAAGSLRGVHHRRDAALLHHHRAAAHGLGAGAVDEGRAHEDERTGHTLSLGSSVSRRPSPSRLMPSTVTRMARPGKVASHHAVDKYARPSASMPPQVGVGGCTPRPRKDRADSITITRAMSRVATTSQGVKALGSTWRARIRQSRLPSATAAWTNSRSRMDSTSPRTTRA